MYPQTPFLNETVKVEIYELRDKFIFFLTDHTFHVLTLNTTHLYCHVVCFCGLLHSECPRWKIPLCLNSGLTFAACLNQFILYLHILLFGHHVCFWDLFSKLNYKDYKVDVNLPFQCASYYTNTYSQKTDVTQRQGRKQFPPSSQTGSQSLCCEVPAAASAHTAESHFFCQELEARL